MLLALAVLGLAAGGLSALKTPAGGSTPGPTAGQQAGAAPDLCAALFTRQCIGPESRDFRTIEDATAVASFEPSLPAYIPAGFRPVLVRHTRPADFAGFVQSNSFKENCSGCDPRLSHNDQIGIYYRDADSRQLAIVQGFPAYVPFYEHAAEDMRGTVRIGSREAFWVRGLPSPGIGWDRRQVVLYWEIGRVGSGWERSPDGTVLTGSPMSYSITSNALTLEELIKIAESVSFD